MDLESFSIRHSDRPDSCAYEMTQGDHNRLEECDSCKEYTGLWDLSVDAERALAYA